ncbi:MAG: AAA family ATPase [Alphaproteobacteria bacterium]|nr:AAA family ATPase [Alphaproteobacteria bacterium]
MAIDSPLPQTKVLVFASQKGGSGKTTLSGHVAVAAELAGAGPVALVDADPQGSLAKWWNVRKASTPAFATTSVPTLARDLETLKRSGIKLIVIDTPPSVTNQITEIISHADLVIVPTRPSPHDLRAVGLTVDLVECQKKPLVFVVNCATARARITSDTAVTLSQHGTVTPVMIHNRVDFAASMIDGRTVGEISPKSRSAREVDLLWSYLNARLEKASIERGEIAPRIERGFEVELLSPMRGGEDEPPSQLRRRVAPSAPGSASGSASGSAPASGPSSTPSREKSLETAGAAAAYFEPRADAPASHAAVEEDRNARPWHGLDRRYADQGPPTGLVDRRRPPTFGRRTNS